MTSKLITINAAKTVAVNQALPWLRISKDTPVGVKLQLINRRFGASTYGHYTPGSDWTHWQGLPKFFDDDDDTQGEQP